MVNLTKICKQKICLTHHRSESWQSTRNFLISNRNLFLRFLAF